MKSRKESYEELAVAICRFIDENYREDISVDILKKHFHTSKSTINRVLRTQLHTSSRYLLNSVRIYKTITSDDTSDRKKFVDIALHHGFSHENLVKLWCGKLIGMELDDIRNGGMKIEFEKLANHEFARVIENYLKILSLGP